MTLPFFTEESCSSASTDEAIPADSNIISAEELATNELDSKVKSMRMEIASMERDVEQISASQMLKDAFLTTKSRFLQFDEEVRASAMICAKQASLSAHSTDHQRDVFATRTRFLKVLLGGCDKYRNALLQMLNHPASEHFRPKRRTLTDKGKLILSKWFDEHKSNPFPTVEEKDALSRQVGAPVEQISTWFINARARRGGKGASVENRRGRKKQRISREEDDDSEYE